MRLLAAAAHLFGLGLAAGRACGVLLLQLLLALGGGAGSDGLECAHSEALGQVPLGLFHKGRIESRGVLLEQLAQQADLLHAAHEGRALGALWQQTHRRAHGRYRRRQARRRKVSVTHCQDRLRRSFLLLALFFFFR